MMGGGPPFLIAGGWADTGGHAVVAGWRPPGSLGGCGSCRRSLDPPTQAGHFPAAADELVDQLVDLAEVVRHLAERLQGGPEPSAERAEDLGGVLADADAPGGV